MCFIGLLKMSVFFRTSSSFSSSSFTSSSLRPGKFARRFIALDPIRLWLPVLNDTGSISWQWSRLAALHCQVTCVWRALGENTKRTDFDTEHAILVIIVVSFYRETKEENKNYTFRRTRDDGFSILSGEIKTPGRWLFFYAVVIVRNTGDVFYTSEAADKRVFERLFYFLFSIDAPPPPDVLFENVRIIQY